MVGTDFAPYFGEFLGTAILILLGDGVVANMILKKTKGNGGGWVVITLGWAFAVAVPALIFGGNGFTNHFNPALTIALYFTGNTDLTFAGMLGYIVAQMLGAFCGACLVYFMHQDHFKATAVLESEEEFVRNSKEEEEVARVMYRAQKAEAQGTMLGVFSTGPAIRNKWVNFMCEVIATFVLLFALTAGFANSPGVFGNWGVFILISALGMSLGGTTGYSLNPARDFGPRVAHAVLPIKGKGDSDWGYAWIPTIGPLVGAILGAIVSTEMFSTFGAISW